MLRIYFIGVFILITAIIANIIVSKIGLSTWYDFGPEFLKRGFSAMKEAGFLSCLWLFIFYPLVLSLGYIIGDKVSGLF
jgi:hypothetical protein